MKESTFSIRVIAPFEFKRGSITSKAASIVKAMEGCPMTDIVAALRSLDHANSPGSPPNPPRWITQLAGLESEASGKALEPWIQIVGNGQVISDKQRFRELLKRQD